MLLDRVGATLRLSERTTTVMLVGWLALTGGLYLRSGWRIDHHQIDRVVTDNVVATIDRTLRRVPVDDPVVLQNEAFPPFIGTVSIYTIFFPPSLDPRIRFVEPDAAVRAGVVVAPPAPPSSGSP